MRDVRLFEAFHKSYGQVSPLLARLARERIAELNADEAELSAVIPPRVDSSERLNASNCKHVAVLVGTGVQRCVAPGSGSFKDCAFCPEMVVVPSGNFVMGSPPHEKDRRADERQLHVTIRQPFAVGKFTVTREEFSVFAKATKFKPTDQGCIDQVASASALTDRHPIVCVTWHEARVYVAWLSKTVGRPYRLLSEAEFEYAARAGTTTPYWWGHEVTRERAHYSAAPGRMHDAEHEPLRGPIRVGRFKANAWGLFDVHGNVWEWTSDCIFADSQDSRGDSYGRSVADCRSARTGARVVRGGSWRNPAAMLRAASRRSARPGRRSDSIGFRVARTLRNE
ncbi:MAG: formylglycine-generating enzyme family protein [Hyphomicrobiaceae bacterium]